MSTQPSAPDPERVLGVDPGLVRTGYGLIAVRGNSMDYIDCGTIRTDPETPMPERLLTIFNGLGAVLLEHAPGHVVIEEVFVNVNAKSSLKLGEARGAAVAALGRSEADIHELSPKEIKRSVAGQGNASKRMMRTMVCGLLGLRPDFDPGSDAFDALACAICFKLSGRINAAWMPAAAPAKRSPEKEAAR